MVEERGRRWRGDHGGGEETVEEERGVGRARGLCGQRCVVARALPSHELGLGVLGDL
jgi:hypothetical protein